MTRIAIDSNIIIYLLQGRLKESEILNYDEIIISKIAWAEVLVDCKSFIEEQKAREFTSYFKKVNLTDDILELSIHYRRTEKLKLPDAMILATARINHCKLMTRNIKDFARFNDIIVPELNS